MKYNRLQLISELKKHEGIVLHVYKDILGIDTIGIGRNLQDRGILEEEFETMSVSSMEEIYENGISEGDAIYLATNDIAIVEDELLKRHPCVENLDPVRQMVLVDMAFNMGVPRLCGFKRMWRNIHENLFHAASIEMLDSKWANQVKSRATKLAERMCVGTKTDW
ncbi:MAG: hypothetical protein VW496_00370 [Pelagibacteraceae bacterium]